MPECMLKFIDYGPETPPKRSAKERARDFAEIYSDYLRDKAEAQAARCSQCGVPFCQSACPLHNNIPDWLRLAAEDRLKEAYQLSSATNSMPEICGRICPQDRLCEGACVIEQSGHGAVTIGAVERTLTDLAFEEGWVAPLKPALEKELSVGIIGSGPAGLAAAESLRVQGWQVHVYERNDRAGGLLIYGIPNFKLDKKIVQRRIKRLQDGGVVFHLNTEVGRDVRLAQLRDQHAAILFANGVYQARRLQIPGSGAKGVFPALQYLTDSNRRGLGDKVGGETAEGKNVVVIGGGDTAMDCVRTAIRQGAKSVTCLYRRDQANMPGSAREVQNAMEEGVHFEWLAAPVAIYDKGGKVSKVRAIRMRLAEKKQNGRQAVSPVAGSEFDIKADMVIEALGFLPEDMQAIAPEAELTDWGTLKADPSRFMTNLPGVYAAGDIVRGASLVVWAIAEGRAAAAAINTYLQEQDDGHD